MKKILKYLLPALFGLTLAACSKESAGETGEGAVRFDITCLQAASRAADAPRRYTIRIYNSNHGLVRRFDETEPLPETLYLLAGDYTIDVEAGDPTNTVFYYKTEAERTQQLYFKTLEEVRFVVKSGEVQELTITVPARHIGSTVCFDPSSDENAHLQNVQIEVLATSAEPADSEAFDRAAEANPVLLFKGLIDTNEQSGCLLPAAGATRLVYRFTAKDGQKEVVQIGTITDLLEPNKLYKTNFRYITSDGYLNIDVQVSIEELETFHDHFEIKTKPSVDGEGFNMGDAQPYTPGSSVSFTCTSLYPIGTIELDDVVIYTGISRIAETVENVTVEPITEKEVKVTLEPAWFDAKPDTGGEAVFRIDGNTYTYKFSKQMGMVAVTQNNYSLWDNTITFQAVIADNPELVEFRYRRAGSQNWITAEAESKGNLRYEATAGPKWNQKTNGQNQTVYTPEYEQGIFANQTYEYELWIDGVKEGDTMRFTTETGQTIPYGDLEDLSLTCWGSKNETTAYWGSGNNTFTSSLCKNSTYAGMQGSVCAKLQATSTLNALASGNLFLGKFKYSGTNGTVSFGHSYQWEARPTSLKLKLWASIGNVNSNNHKTIIEKNQPDQASIYVAIVDWDEPHNVRSGTDTPQGVWSVEDGSNPTDSDGKPVGTIIGYGTLYPQGKTDGEAMIDVEIPIYYYDTAAKPGKTYTLVIGCSTSRYGDWMNGCSTNTMYIDDFRWGYDAVAYAY